MKFSVVLATLALAAPFDDEFPGGTVFVNSKNQKVVRISDDYMVATGFCTDLLFTNGGAKTYKFFEGECILEQRLKRIIRREATI
jgi:hypothetical protein